MRPSKTANQRKLSTDPHIPLYVHVYCVLQERGRRGSHHANVFQRERGRRGSDHANVIIENIWNVFPTREGVPRCHLLGVFIFFAKISLFCPLFEEQSASQNDNRVLTTHRGVVWLARDGWWSWKVWLLYIRLRNKPNPPSPPCL